VSDPFDDLNRISLVLIGDEVVYRPGGGVALNPPIKAWADHSDANIGFGNVAGTTPDPTVEVRVIDVPVPSKLDVIELPRLGRSFHPASWPRSPDGRHWQMTLKRAAT